MPFLMKFKPAVVAAAFEISRTLVVRVTVSPALSAWFFLCAASVIFSVAIFR